MIQQYSIPVPRQPAARLGFTLIELLVVIGIIALLVGLLLPTLSRVRSNARTARTLADLQAIATALEVYKSDLGDYPPSTGASGISGGEVLAWALVGPYSTLAAGPYNATDGKDGPGFRLQHGPGPDGILGNADDVFRGSVYGPYVDAEKFLLPSGGSYFLKDGYGQPILYFRRVSNPGNNTDPSTIYTVADNAGVSAGNTQPLNRPVAATAQARFNAIVLREKATGPYLLWSAGLDAAFGPEKPLDPKQVKSCDDVLFSGGQ